MFKLNEVIQLPAQWLKRTTPRLESRKKNLTHPSNNSVGGWAASLFLLRGHVWKISSWSTEQAANGGGSIATLPPG